jgi:anti-sigma regulatory factor (Ser/Thr protein kinase)
LDGSKEDAVELEVAVGELLANAYRHAYRQVHGPMQIDLAFDDKEIEVSISDEGDVITDTLAIPLAASVGDKHCGLYLVSKLTDRVHIVHPRTARGGTRIHITKCLRHDDRLMRHLRIVGDFGEHPSARGGEPVRRGDG